MRELLTSKNTVIEDDEIISKFTAFRDGISDILTYLYEKDGYYYLLLSPYDSLFLEEDVCVKVYGKDALLKCFNELACNFGLMIIEDKGKLSYFNGLGHSVRCVSYVYDLISFDDFYIQSKDKKESLLRGDELTSKLKKMIPSIFGSNRNPFLSPYIYNCMYTRTLLPYSLNSFEFVVLDNYKRRGYEYINSFLGNGELKRVSGLEVVDRDFIDNLYYLYGVFDKFPPLEEDIVVFRGANEEEVLKSNYNSFISTSLDITVASSFSSCLLYEIILPKGTHYIPVDAIDELSTIFGETEAEILLRPSSFEIITSGIRKEYNYLKVLCHEKDNFGEIVVDALERRKDELIKRNFCDLEGYEDALEYAKSKIVSSKVKVLK